MEYHPVVRKITDLLASHHCVFRTFEHAPVRTSEEAQRLRPEYSMHQGAKALIVKIKKAGEEPRFVMLIFPADLKFDGKKVKAMLGAKDVSFATEEQVATLTGGIQVGGVPPFGNLFDLPVYVDQRLFENEEIIFNAGDRSFSVAMKVADWWTLVNPKVANFTA